MPLTLGMYVTDTATGVKETTELKAHFNNDAMKDLQELFGLAAKTEVVRCLMMLIAREAPSATLKLCRQVGLVPDPIPVTLTNMAEAFLKGVQVVPEVALQPIADELATVQETVRRLRAEIERLVRGVEKKEPPPEPPACDPTICEKGRVLAVVAPGCEAEEKTE